MRKLNITILLLVFTLSVFSQADTTSSGVNKSLLNNNSYATGSVLSTGTWFKIGITNTGIHKITYSDLEKLGIDPSSLNISKLGIFGNYNGLLPESNAYACIDDLSENSIFFSGNEDGTFSQSDYILFYAQGPTTWSYVNNPFETYFKHQNNIYSDTTYYFLTTDKGTFKQIESFDGSALQSNIIVKSFNENVVYENDYDNLLSSGKEWYGETFTTDTSERVFTFNFPNLIADNPIDMEIVMAGRAFTKSYWDVAVNNSTISDSTEIRFVSTSLGIHARKSIENLSFLSDNDNINVKVKYYSNDPNAIAWLDYITLNVERELIYNTGQMKFFNVHSYDPGRISKFDIQTANPNVNIWDITDIHNPMSISTVGNGDSISFTVPTDSLRTFVAFDNTEFYSPVSYRKVENQNLHGISNVNYIIVRPKIFEAQAEELANIHRENDGLVTICVSPEEIYNEFSSGSQDISAIRNFMKMLYNKGAFGSDRKYLLLFGDASFDYKNRIAENTNIVPTYEALESLRETGSFVTDDYFGLLDENEGANVGGNLDVGIGRFPISTQEEATVAVAKISKYLTHNKQLLRDWRTKICFVSDDEDNNLHLHQAKGLIRITDTLNDGIKINKIYCDAFQKITVPGGSRYPEVSKKISEQVENGALVINYTGHGGVISWSEEHVLDVQMINGYKNINNMPLIVTATCEFSRYDNPEFTSAGEYFFLNENGGAIALLTTTRLAYAHANYIVNKRLYKNLLLTEDGYVPRLGDLVRLSKIPSNDNYLNFVLLGDPALTLAYPKYNVVTSENKSFVKSVSDTINGLSLVKVSGEIVDNDNIIVDNFNGYLYPKVYDKASLYTTRGNTGSSYPEDFTLFDKILYKGKIDVIDGKFNFEFMVPKDIAYNYGYGKIQYYAVDTSIYVDAWGAYDKLYIGGIDDEMINDNYGPEISLYLNKSTFKPGDVVTSNPILLSFINDESGVNSTGNGIGHDIVVTIDDDFGNSMIVNNYFDMDVNTYKSGKVIFPFSNLSEGEHTLTIKAWDLQNNSTEKTIRFFVNNSSDIQLYEVINYPNPFDKQTTFKFDHNKSGANITTTIRIYDINGRFVTKLSSSSSANSNKIVWYGKDENGNVVSPGIYVYTTEVVDDYGNVTVRQQKLFKINQ